MLVLLASLMLMQQTDCDATARNAASLLHNMHAVEEVSEQP
jgi:hypothetical protein